MTGKTTRKYVTINELADLSGLSLSTLRRRIEDGTLPVIQPGGPRSRMLFDPNVFDQLLERPTTRSREFEPHESEGNKASRAKNGHRISGPSPRWKTRKS